MQHPCHWPHRLGTLTLTGGVFWTNTSVTRRKVHSRRSAHWFTGVVEEVKQQGRRDERKRRKTGLTLHNQIHNRAKNCVTKVVHAAMASYFCHRIRESLLHNQLFNLTNPLRGGNPPPPNTHTHTSFSWPKWLQRLAPRAKMYHSCPQSLKELFFLI